MPSIVFEIEREFIELSSLLKATGLCATGGEAKQLIADGQVRVDGQVEQRRKRKLRTGAVIDCRGQRVELVTAPG